jgi:DNA-binding XRE family transcriptional regulator
MNFSNISRMAFMNFEQHLTEISFGFFVASMGETLSFYSMDSKRRQTKLPAERLKEHSESGMNTGKQKPKVKLLTSLEELLESEHGKIGTASRNEFEAEYEAFKLGVLLQEARKKQCLTQEQLAKRVGTTKNYISRIENDASDIRLATLMRIINGLGGQLTLTV